MNGYKIRRLGSTILLITLIVIASVMTAARLFLPQLKGYRDDLATRISEQVGAPVTIGKMRVGMRGFTPELVLKEVDVYDNGSEKSLIQFQEISVGIDAQHAIFQQQLKPAWISVLGADLSIIRNEKGNISIVGLKASDDLPYWLFENGRFEFLKTNISWHDQTTQKPPLHFPSVDLAINNNGESHQVRLLATLSQDLGGSLTMSMDFQGDPFVPEWRNGALYAEGKSIDVARLLTGQNFQNYRIDDGKGDFKIWSQWQNSNLQSVSGYIDVTGPKIARTIETNPKTMSLDKLTGWFRWLYHDRSWQADVNRLVITNTGQTGPESRLAIIAKKDQAGDLQAIDAISSYLRLENLTQLIELGPVDVDHKNLLRNLSPSGSLETFHLSYRRKPDHGSDWAVCGGIHIDDIKGYQDYPGLHQWRGTLCSDRHRGAISLASEQGTFDYPSYFRKPISIQSMNGTLWWAKNEEGWRIRSDRFQLDTQDLSLKTRIAVNQESDGNGLFVDIQAAFRQQDSKNIKSYLPASTLDEDLVEWLDNAFHGGTVENGQFMVYGPVEEYPFRNAQGMLQSRFDVKNMKLQFHEDWIPITNLNAEVSFHNEKATVSLVSGNLLRGNLTKTSVHFPDMINEEYLLVDGNVHGEISQTMRYLRQSPMRQEIVPFLDVARFSGHNAINLYMKIPLNDDDETRVKGLAKFTKSSVYVDDLAMTISDLDGAISFTEDQFNGDKINGKMLDAPAHFHLHTTNNRVNLGATTSASIKALKKQFPFSFWDYFNGKAKFAVDLTIPELAPGQKSLSTEIKVTSNLVGVESMLPAPYAKKKSAAENFQLNLSLAESKPIPVVIRYGDIARARLTFSPPESETAMLIDGSVLLGEGAAQKSNKSGVNLTVNLDRVDLDSWWKFYRSKYAGEENAPQKMTSIDFVTRDLIWQGKSYGGVDFGWQEGPSSWKSTIKSDYADGEMQGPVKWSTDALLTMDFEHLKIPKSENFSRSADATRIDPAKLPNIQIKSRHLYWINSDLGSLELVAKKRRRGLTIDSFIIKSENHNLSMTGHWIQGGSKVLTELNGHLSFTSLGRFLQDFEVSDELTETAADIDFELEWYGPLYSPHTEKLNGFAKMELNKGRLLGVEPGIGRALGILSLDTWKRRLSLDFSDLYAEGLAFDKIKGDFYIKNGDAFTDPLEIDAVSAGVFATGRIGLVTKDFDQTITVVPKSSASLPIAGAIAGGPAVGAAIFVAQKLIGDDVDSIASTQYLLKGPWKDPQVRRLQGKGGILDRAWTGLKDVTGFSKQNELENTTNED